MGQLLGSETTAAVATLLADKAPLALISAVLFASTVYMSLARAKPNVEAKSVTTRKDYQTGVDKFLYWVCALGILTPYVWLGGAAFGKTFPCESKEPASVGRVLLGAAFLMAGTRMVDLAHRDLGKNWSHTLAVREGHKLVTSGIYARIRHPMYTGFVLFAIGTQLACANWLLGGMYAMGYFSLLAHRLVLSNAEEEMMLKEFGQEYVEYKKRSWNLVPYVF